MGAYGNNPGAYGAICDEGWAVADISRPNVGTTDGITVFKTAADGTWVEVGDIGYALAECTLESAGVPPQRPPS